MTTPPATLTDDELQAIESPAELIAALTRDFLMLQHKACSGATRLVSVRSGEFNLWIVNLGLINDAVQAMTRERDRYKLALKGEQ